MENLKTELENRTQNIDWDVTIKDDVLYYSATSFGITVTDSIELKLIQYVKEHILIDTMITYMLNELRDHLFERK